MKRYNEYKDLLERVVEEAHFVADDERSPLWEISDELMNDIEEAIKRNNGRLKKKTGSDRPY